VFDAPTSNETAVTKVPQTVKEALQATSTQKKSLNEAVIALKSGDISAYDKIYGEMYRTVFVAAKVLTKNDFDAEDVTQEVFIRVYNKIGTLADVGALKAWILTITRNVSLNKIKKASKSEITVDEGAEHVLESVEETSITLLPEVAAMSTAKSEIIMKLVSLLPYEQKEAVLLRYIHQRSVTEIAAMTDTTTGTVKSRLNYARQKIKSLVLAEEERSGVKLYSVGLWLFLPLMLRFFAKTMPLSPSTAAVVLKGVKSSTAITATATTSVAATSATAVGGTAGAIVSCIGINAIIATTVIATCIAGTGVALINSEIFSDTDVSNYRGVDYAYERESLSEYDFEDGDEVVTAPVSTTPEPTPMPEPTPTSLPTPEPTQVLEDEGPEDEEELTMYLADVAGAYLQILESEGEPEFWSEDWMERDDLVRNGIVKASVLDINNDGIPELIFIRQDENDEDRWDLLVYSFEDDDVIEMFRIEGVIFAMHDDINAGLYSLNNGGIVVQTVFYTGGSSSYIYEIYDGLTFEKILSRRFDIESWDEDMQDLESLRFYVDDVEVTEEEYIRERSLFYLDFEFSLTGWGYHTFENFPLIIPDTIDVSMTYAEALAYLESILDS